MDTVYISPSSLATFENCPRLYQYEKILKVATEVTSCNLGFGGACASAMDTHLRGHLANQWVDPVAEFHKHWDLFTNGNNVQYKKGLAKEDLTAVGERLMSLFPEAWRESGFQIVLDLNGQPIMERKLKVDMGHGVVLTTKLDLMVMDADGKVFIIDAKTPASPSSVDFTLMGDQLTAYQIAISAHSERLGLPPIDGVGYWDLVKRPIPKTSRGVGPVIMEPCIASPRTGREINQFVQKLHETADRIRAKQFHKTPRMA